MPHTSLIWKANLTTKNLLKQYKNFIISRTQESEWQTCTMEGKCILEGNVLFLWIQGFPSFTQLFLQDIAYLSFLHRNCFQLLPVICWQHLWYCDGFKRLAPHLVVLCLCTTVKRHNFHTCREVFKLIHGMVKFLKHYLACFLAKIAE